MSIALICVAIVVGLALIPVMQNTWDWIVRLNERLDTHQRWIYDCQSADSEASAKTAALERKLSKHIDDATKLPPVTESK